MTRYRKADDFLGSFFFGDFESQITKYLEEVAKKIAEDAKRNANTNMTAKGNTLPSVIADAISVGKVEASGHGRYSISINVDLEKAPMAAAYEYGSGERGPKGQDYPIVAKNAPALAFLWEYPSPLGRKYIVPEDEFVKFKRIMHPGVEAVPYLQPAIDDNTNIVANGVLTALHKALQNTTVKVVYIEADK
jgi:hypothetical protein